MKIRINWIASAAILLTLVACGGGGGSSSSSATTAYLPADIAGRSIEVTNVSGNNAPAGSVTTYSFTATSITGSGPGGTFTGTYWTYTGTTGNATVTIYYGSNSESYNLTPTTNTTGTFTYSAVLSGVNYSGTGTYRII